MKRKLIAGILALALGVTTAFAMVAAQTNSSGPVSMGVDGRLDGPCEMSQLTDEEREEIQQQLHEYQQDLLEQYGINLTVEQRGEIRRAMQGQQQEMRQQMEEFRKELFAQYGIDLTDEEREEIRQQMEEYREELFEGYGVSCPAGPQCAGGEGNGPRGHIGHMDTRISTRLRFQRAPTDPSRFRDLEERNNVNRGKQLPLCKLESWCVVFLLLPPPTHLFFRFTGCTTRMRTKGFGSVLSILQAIE